VLIDRIVANFRKLRRELYGAPPNQVPIDPAHRPSPLLSIKPISREEIEIEDIARAAHEARVRAHRDHVYQQTLNELRRKLAALPRETSAQVDPAERKTQTALAAARQAVVVPILESKHWTTNKWGTSVGVGKSCPYDYLSGKRKLTDENRKALTEVLELKPEDLPD
jgi:hypothetical protein